MGNALFVALGLLTIALGVVNRRAFVLLIILMAGVPVSLMTGDAAFFAALGGMSGQAAWLFAIVVGCVAALISYLARIHLVIARTPLFLMFLLFALLSLSWADSLLDGVRMLAKLSAPVLFFWIVMVMRPDERLSRRAELALYATCLIAVLLALVNTLGGGVLAPLPLKSGLLGLPAFATPFSSPANFSFLMVVGAVTAYCRFLESRRILHLCLFLLLMLAVVLAFVRISLAGALLGVAAVHLARARPLATVACAALAALAAMLLVTSDVFMERTFFVPERVQWGDAITAPEKFWSNVNTSGRTLLWSRATRAFADESPWVGAGVGSVDAWINSGDSFSSELHSEVFRVRLELGWLGLGLFLLGLFGLWWRMLRTLRSSPRGHHSVALRASCASLPVYALTLLTDNTINYAAGFGILVFGFAALALAGVLQPRTAPSSMHDLPVNALQSG